jgi:hypothetical protein
MIRFGIAIGILLVFVSSSHSAQTLEIERLSSRVHLDNGDIYDCNIINDHKGNLYVQLSDYSILPISTERIDSVTINPLYVPTDNRQSDGKDYKYGRYTYKEYGDKSKSDGLVLLGVTAISPGGWNAEVAFLSDKHGFIAKYGLVADQIFAVELGVVFPLDNRENSTTSLIIPFGSIEGQDSYQSIRYLYTGALIQYNVYGFTLSGGMNYGIGTLNQPFQLYFSIGYLLRLGGSA